MSRIYLGFLVFASLFILIASHVDMAAASPALSGVRKPVHMTPWLTDLSQRNFRVPMSSRIMRLIIDKTPTEFNCYNGRLDQGETSVDCGGPCNACDVNTRCEENADCDTGFCEDICAITGIGTDCKTCVVCTDDDPTNDIHITGTVRHPGGKIVTDTCKSSTIVNQANCNYLTGEVTWWENRCSPGETCEDGRCSRPTGNSFIPSEPERLNPYIEPSEQDRQYCEEPDPTQLPNYVHYWDISGERHISYCSSADSVRYVICAADGRLTVNVFPCRCNSGICNGQGMSSPPRTQHCIEFDGGINPYLSSYGTPNQYRYYVSRSDYIIAFDFCVNHTQLAEQYCDGDYVRRTYIDCLPGEACDPETNSCRFFGDGDPNEPTDCADPDHNRTDMTSCVTYREGFDAESECDECIDENTVRERICVDGRPDSVVLTCPEGKVCNVGACSAPFEPGCTDTDGRNPNTSGNVSYSRTGSDRAVMMDSCINEHQVREYYCEGNEMREDVIDCASSEECDTDRGICIPLRSRCFDTDPNDDVSQAGYIAASENGSHHDYCDGNTLHQLGCSEMGEIIQTDTRPCESGCENGACL